MNQITFDYVISRLSIKPTSVFLISKSVAGVGVLLLGSLVMGFGIAVMHYLGMAAMRITPSVSYDPVWFTISILIAVGASGAALAICRYTQRLVGRQAVGFRRLVIPAGC